MTSIIILFLILFGISFIVTPSNAKYTLSGYNTASKEEHAKYDINKLVPYINRGIRITAIITLITSSIAYYFENKTIVAFCLSMIPMIGILTTLVFGSLKYIDKKASTSNYIAYILILLTIILSLYLFIYHPDKINLDI